MSARYCSARSAPDTAVAVPLNTLALKFPLLSRAAIVLAVLVVFAVLEKNAWVSLKNQLIEKIANLFAPVLYELFLKKKKVKLI